MGTGRSKETKKGTSNSEPEEQTDSGAATTEQLTLIPLTETEWEQRKINRKINILKELNEDEFRVFPQEVVEYICRFLDNKSLSRFNRTNWAWYFITSRDSLVSTFCRSELSNWRIVEIQIQK